MTITLNTSVPENRRPQIEALVRNYSHATRIVWLPSRFQRFVMLVEPGADSTAEASNESIFDSPQSGFGSLAAMTEILESRIKACLATPA